MLNPRGRKEALAQAHPEEPWLWRKDWAEGRIRHSATSLAGPLLFATLWNILCGPLWFIVPGEALRTGDVEAWLVMAFPIMGLGLLCWAGVAVMRWRKYGRSVFEMASVPGVIGGQLAGVIRIPVKVEPEDAFRIALRCISCVMTSGSERHISRSTIWQDEQAVARELLKRDERHSAIPVLFQIPYECSPTDDSGPDKVVFWNLEVTAKAPGLDYFADFEVPVFKTPQSDPHFAIDRDLIAKYSAPVNPQRDLRDAGVVRMPSPSGGSTTHFPRDAGLDTRPIQRRLWLF